VPTKRLGIELAKIDGAWIEEAKFPRPQWKVIYAWVKQHVEDESLPIAWHEISCDWVSSLKKHLGEHYFIYESPNFILLTGRSRDAGKAILQTCELAVKFLVSWLGPIAEKRGQGKHVILDFDSSENYYDYVSYFYPAGSPPVVTGGVFLRDGYHHIALPPAQQIQDVLVHELTHNRVAHLPLPKWLNEGIAVTMERKISGNKNGQVDRELHRKHRGYWSTETISAFWNGRSFVDIEGDTIHLSYNLAEVLVDLLVQEFPNFLEFVSEANYKDAGESAAAKCFDISLNDLASTFLGPGDWTPRCSVPKRGGVGREPLFGLNI
jgi:hypothetical protein